MSGRYPTGQTCKAPTGNPVGAALLYGYDPCLAHFFPAQALAAPVTVALVLPLHGGAAPGTERKDPAGGIPGQLPDLHGLPVAQGRPYLLFHSSTISRNSSVKRCRPSADSSPTH